MLNERIDQLSATGIFQGLSREALASLAAIANEETFSEGVIFRQGDVGDKLYVILDGKVRVSRDLSGMGEEALAVFGPGASFGEMSLLDDAERSADARVHAPCRLLVIHKDAFRTLLRAEKDLAYDLLWNVVRTLAARLRETNDKLTFLSVTSKF